mmetsp:Transcript_33540/g.94168  ORF Transcript_33540/g.94168 Transcript_33540/m.94168 type:complete len:295 (+) Transcript_33540:1878-2762(+)
MRHGVSMSPQWNVLHMLNSASLPSHIVPPCIAGSRIFRSRVLSPPPQLFVHWLQSDQRSKLQGDIGANSTLQPAVSWRLPWHIWPSLAAYWRTDRLRKRCDSCVVHWPQLSQAASLQSSGAAQLCSQCLVSVSRPSHGAPPFLFMRAMVRCRSQSCVHMGSDQAPQSPKAQSTGDIFSSQLGRSQALSCSCVPEHDIGDVPSKMYSSGSSSKIAMDRSRSRVAGPQSALQGLEVDQSDHAQKRASEQSLRQVEVSWALVTLHSLPQWFGSVVTERCRYRWPPHLEQAPQSDHMP